jgi:hypothetical protein
MKIPFNKSSRKDRKYRKTRPGGKKTTLFREVGATCHLDLNRV